MEVKLIAMSPKGNKKIFPLATQEITIGRQHDCELHIPLLEISRRHCKITVSGDSVDIKDLGSANGTFVDNEQITEKKLKPGNVISLAGAINFMVQIDNEPAEIDEEKLKVKPTVLEEGEAKKPAVPAESFEATSATSTEDKIADQILGDSFFMDMEEDDEEI